MTTDWTSLSWLNPPLSSSTINGELHVETRNGSDFWQKTFYGFQHDDGHLLQRQVQGEFTAETTFTGQYQELYDQAGLMLRQDALNWLKCGVEYTDGVAHFSTVATVNGHSDWSAFALEDHEAAIGARVTRLGDALFVQYQARPGDIWRMARLAFFPATIDQLAVGIMACSPKRKRFSVRFHGFEITEPVSRDIH